MPTYRQLSLSVNKEASIRTASFDNEEYLVVPCICLIGDSVVFGLNAKGPEFIPAEEIAFSTPQWSGRPVVPNHPNNGNTTANLPHILESQRFGWTFYPEFSDNKLKMEAWLSRSRAEKVGDSALSVITNLESGMIVELSVGAWVEIEEREGTAPNGEQYVAVWHGIASDHLALGLEGGIGACSIDMGCGGLRVNGNGDVSGNGADAGTSTIDNDVTRTNQLAQSPTLLRENQNHVIPESESIGVTMATITTSTTAPTVTTPAATQPTTPPIPTPIVNDKELGLLSRLMSHIRMPSLRSNVEDTGPSDWNVRMQIADALYMSEPGFGWVEDVFQDSGTVIYSVFPFSPHEKYYRRTFTIGANDIITLGESKEQVKKPMDRWETMTMESEDSTVTPEMAATGANPCSCNRDYNQTVTATSNATVTNNREGESITMASPELINRFASLPDDKLTKLLASLEDNATTTTTPPTTPTPAPTPPDPPPADLTPEQTEEQYLANAPESVKQIVAEHKAQAAARRTVLLSALSTQSVFTKEQLALKSNAELEQLVALANVNDPNAVEVDYSFARATPAAMGGSYKNQPPPDPYSVHFGRNMRTGEKIEPKTN